MIPKFGDRPATSGHVWALLALFTAASAGAAGEAEAQEGSGSVQIHCLGTSAYGRTSHENSYAVGNPSGDYDHMELSTIIIAQPHERLTIATNGAIEQSGEGTEAAIDYAFAEWRFNDSLKLRAGRVKQPFGLYTEIIDVGTLRPFLVLPQGQYGSIGFVSEGFDGLSLTGRLLPTKAWSLAYDVYVGSIRFSADEARPGEGSEDSHAIGGERVRDIIGGRLTVLPPSSGLAVGVSGYTGQEDAGRHSAVAAHAEWLPGKWSARSEYARLVEGNGIGTNAFYVELARRLGHWEVAGRYERARTESGGEIAAVNRHRDAVLGVNYWFSSHFVLKASYHRVDGNLFARPEDSDSPEESSNEAVQRTTDMVTLGAQFGF